MTELSDVLWLIGGIAALVGPSLLVMRMDSRQHATCEPTAAQSRDDGSSVYNASPLMVDSCVSTTSCDMHHGC